MAARPLYFRLLRVRHLRLRPVATLALFEGSIGGSFLLYLADVVPLWGVLVLATAIAAMVKLHDIVAGLLAEAVYLPSRRATIRARGVATVPGHRVRSHHHPDGKDRPEPAGGAT